MGRFGGNVIGNTFSSRSKPALTSLLQIFPNQSDRSGGYPTPF